MLNVLSWNKPLVVNGVEYPNSKAAYEALKDFDGEVEIRLNCPVKPKVEEPKVKLVEKDEWWRIEVKAWMTMPGLDFHEKYNPSGPMPSRVMVCKVLKETKGMAYVTGHLRPEPSTKCIHCGRRLTNPVSFNYGIGPICGGHMNIAPPKDMEDFKARKEEIKKRLADVHWEGWIAKSAIVSMTPAVEEADSVYA